MTADTAPSLLLTMSNFSPHTTFLSSNFASAFSRLFGSHKQTPEIYVFSNCKK